ncbi:MAG: thioredoxin family protein [Candidatus Dormibacteraceae bacterium]
MAETREELETALADESRLVLLAFLDDGCEPCRELRPDIEALGATAADVCRVLIVNAAQERGQKRGLVERYGVTSFPTLVFLKGGVELQRMHGGALPASTRSLLERASLRE